MRDQKPTAQVPIKATTGHTKINVAVSGGLALILLGVVWLQHHQPQQQHSQAEPESALDHQLEELQSEVPPAHLMQMASLTLPPPPPLASQAAPNKPPVSQAVSPAPPVPEVSTPEVSTQKVTEITPLKPSPQEMTPPQQVTALQPRDPVSTTPEPLTFKALQPERPEPRPETSVPDQTVEVAPPQDPLPDLQEIAAIADALTSVEEEDVIPVPQQQEGGPPEESQPSEVQSSESPSSQPTRPETVMAVSSDRVGGAVALRMMEHGEGPGIEMAWPQSSQDRAQVWKTLSRCMGMTVARLSPQGQLFRASDPAGQAWQLNPDQWSGYVRQVGLAATVAEERALQGIASWHGLPQQMASVRVFPRHQDSAWLGALGRHIGTSIATVQSVRLEYAVRGQGVALTDIVADGRPVPGDVWIVPAQGCGRVS